MASDEEREHARARGVEMGFAGAFLDEFVANELKMLQRSRYRKARSRIAYFAKKDVG
jgi:hypothetical protein